jgi:protein-tyrosine-phosphatase
MKEDYQMDMASHQSKLLNKEDVKEAHLIIPVKKDLGELIRYMFPESEKKLFYLQQDIPDPWRQPVSVFRSTAQSIDELLDPIVDKLKN